MTADLVFDVCALRAMIGYERVLLEISRALIGNRSLNRPKALSKRLAQTAERRCRRGTVGFCCLKIPGVFVSPFVVRLAVFAADRSLLDQAGWRSVACRLCVTNFHAPLVVQALEACNRNFPRRLSNGRDHVTLDAPQTVGIVARERHALDTSV